MAAKETPNVCPLYCRACGVALVKEREWLEKITFSENVFKGSQLDYRILLTCPRRLGFWGFWHDNHDRREFDRDDCSKEYF